MSIRIARRGSVAKPTALPAAAMLGVVYSSSSNYGPNSLHSRGGITTSAACSVVSVYVKMHGGGSTGIVKIKQLDGTVLATSQATDVTPVVGGGNYVEFVLPTPVALPAGTYYVDGEWATVTSPEVGNLTRTYTTGFITDAPSPALYGDAAPAATAYAHAVPNYLQVGIFGRLT